MESQRIAILLQKYFEAETDPGEENELITYFNSGEVSDELKPFIPMFSGFKVLSETEDGKLDDDLMNFILESEPKEKLRDRWLWQIVSGVAAAAILALLVINYYSQQNQWNDTFTNADQAYAEASKTLDFIAGKYNKGMAQLEPVGKIEEAVSPLYSGLNKLDEGFRQMRKVEMLNKKLKKE